MARRLKPEELRAVCEPASLPFASTADLQPLEGVIGQERAVHATSFGVGMRQAGYNLFVLGPARTGKASIMKRILTQTAFEPPPSDSCYIHNFQDSYRPRALALPAGRGRELRQEMKRLVDECQLRLQRAFESEEFERQKAQLLERFGHRQQQEMARFEEAARAEKFAVLHSPGGWAVAPAPQGEPLTTEEYEALPETVKQERGTVLHVRLDAALRQMRQLEREARVAQEKLVRDVAAEAVHQLIQELREQFAGLTAVGQYLDEVEQDLVAHAEEFRSLAEGKPALPFLPAPGGFLDRYRVNVMVDRSGACGAPVVLEPNPTYGNLVGRVEHRVHFGTLVTDFTLIKAGALHRANGGYLLLEAVDILRSPLAWDALKKALKSGAVRIEDPLEEWRVASAMGLAPEPIPLSVKVVLIGSPLLYYLLCAFDEDFRELFKVKVDFDDSLPRTPDFELLYARFVAGACREEGLPHFAPGGVAKLIEHCSRLVSEQGRLTSRLGDVVDLIRESTFLATRRNHALVQDEDVRGAIAQRIDRENLLEERTRRVITDGVLLIATDDYLDIFEAPDEITAARVVMITRSCGHAQTEPWTALPWERFEIVLPAA